MDEKLEFQVFQVWHDDNNSVQQFKNKIKYFFKCVEIYHISLFRLFRVMIGFTFRTHFRCVPFVFQFTERKCVFNVETFWHSFVHRCPPRLLVLLHRDKYEPKYWRSGDRSSIARILIFSLATSKHTHALSHTGIFRLSQHFVSIMKGIERGREREKEGVDRYFLAQACETLYICFHLFRSQFYESCHSSHSNAINIYHQVLVLIYCDSVFVFFFLYSQQGTKYIQQVQRLQSTTTFIWPFS